MINDSDSLERDRHGRRIGHVCRDWNRRTRSSTFHHLDSVLRAGSCGWSCFPTSSLIDNTRPARSSPALTICMPIERIERLRRWLRSTHGDRGCDEDILWFLSVMRFAEGDIGRSWKVAGSVHVESLGMFVVLFLASFFATLYGNLGLLFYCVDNSVTIVQLYELICSRTLLVLEYVYSRPSVTQNPLW